MLGSLSCSITLRWITHQLLTRLAVMSSSINLRYLSSSMLVCPSVCPLFLSVLCTYIISSLSLLPLSYTHTQPFNGPLSGTTRVSWYQKGKTNLDLTEARDSECQWHQLGHMQVCTSLQTDNPASTPPLSFLQAGCPSCRPTNSVKALKAIIFDHI